MKKTIGVLCYNLCAPTVDLLERIAQGVEAQVVIYPLQSHQPEYTGPLRVGRSPAPRSHIRVPSLGTKERLMSALCFPTVRQAARDSEVLLVLGLLGAPLASLLFWRVVYSRPVVLVTQMLPVGLERRRPRLLRWLKARLLNGPYSYVAQTRATVETLRELYGVQAESITYAPFTPALHGGAGTSRLGICREDERNAAGSLRLLFVGTLYHLKGLDVLLESLLRLRHQDVRLTIAGAPPADEPQYWEGLQRSPQYRSLADRISYVGQVPPCELADLYMGHDVLIHPTRKDVWPKVLEEALSSGMPVITTTHCGAGVDLIQPGQNGFIVPAGDASALAGVIGTLARDRAVLQSMRAYLATHRDRSMRRIEETGQITQLLGRILHSAGGLGRVS